MFAVSSARMNTMKSKETSNLFLICLYPDLRISASHAINAHMAGTPISVPISRNWLCVYILYLPFVMDEIRLFTATGVTPKKKRCTELTMALRAAAQMFVRPFSVDVVVTAAGSGTLLIKVRYRLENVVYNTS